MGLTRRQVILAKIEATYGSDETPLPTADAILAYDIDMSQVGETLERPILRDTLSHLPHVVGLQEQQITFKVELKGDATPVGTAPNPQWTPLLAACGFATSLSGTSLTFTPTSQESNQKSVSIHVFTDGNLHIFTGARGNAKFNFEAGQFPFIEFEFSGLYNTATTDTVPTLTNADDNITPPVVWNSAFKIGTYAPITRAVAIDLRNNVTRREDISATKGVNSFRIGDRNPQITWDADAVTEATNPFFQNFDESTGKAFNIHFGVSSATQRNTFGFSCPLFMTESIKYGDDDGILTYDLVGVAASSAPAGNDELIIHLN